MFTRKTKRSSLMAVINTMTKRLSGLVLGLFALASFAAADVYINELGYRSSDKKVFRTNESASTFTILNSNGSVVKTGTLSEPLWDAKAGFSPRSGDFSSVRKSGTYTIKLDTGSESVSFDVGNESYLDLYRAAIRGLHVSRCGQAVEDLIVGHPICHAETTGFRLDGIDNGPNGVSNGEPAGSSKFRKFKKFRDNRDVKGGWHNGGDYRRSTLSASLAISRILSLMELHSSSFDYDKIGTELDRENPANTWGDAYLELRHGLDWLMSMQDDEGGVSIGIAPANKTEHASLTTFPNNDGTKYYIGAVHSANTAKTGAALAKAARLYQSFAPAYAEKLKARSELAYQWMKANKGSQGTKDTAYSYQFNGTWMWGYLWHSIELYRLTKDSKYHNDFVNNYRTFVNGNSGFKAGFPEEKADTHAIRKYSGQEASVAYLQMPLAKNKDIADALRSGLRKKADQWSDWSEQRGFGNILSQASGNDYWTHRHTIGNTLHKAWTLLNASFIFNSDRYRDIAIEQLNFVLGQNPLGKTFVSGFGSDPVRKPHYRPAAANNQRNKNKGINLVETPPGLLVKGPSRDSTFVNNNSSIKNRSAMKSYIDKPEAHQVNEPDIEVQAYLIAWAGYMYASAENEQAEPDSAQPAPEDDDGTVNQPSQDQSPFANKLRTLPSRIQAEHFDNGANGEAWFDKDERKGVTDYRPYTDVDLEAVDDGSTTNYALAHTQSGEWVEYTVDIEPGEYSIKAQIAGLLEDSALSFSLYDLEGAKVQDFEALTLQATGGWAAWQTFEQDIARIDVAGTHIVRMSIDKGPVNIDWFEFVKLEAPFVPVTEALGTVRLQDSLNGLQMHATANEEFAHVSAKAFNETWRSQEWIFEKVQGTNDQYRIKNRWAKRYLNVANKNTNQAIKLKSFNKDWWSQIWKIERSDNRYRIYNLWTGLYLTAGDGENAHFVQAEFDPSGRSEFLLDN